MKKISSQISIMIITCCCVSMLLVSLLSLRGIISKTRQEAETTFVNMAGRYAEQFSFELALIENKVEDIYIHIRDTIDVFALRTDPDYLEKYQQELAVFMQYYADNYTESVSAYCYFNPSLSKTPQDVYFVDGNGDGNSDRQAHIPLSYYNGMPEKDDDKYWWYGPAETGELVWTNPYEWTLKNNNNEIINVVSCAKPFFVDGKLIAVVGTYYHFDKMNNDIANIKVYENGYASLINDKLDFIVHPKYFTGNRNNSDNMYSVENGQMQSLCEPLLENEEGVLTYTVDNQSKMLAYATLSNGWKMVLSPVVSEVYASVTQLVFQIALLFVGCCIFAIIIAHHLGKTFAKPLQTMIKATKEISEGNYTVRVGSKTKDELGDLGNSLDEMAGSIGSLTSELEKLAFYDPLTNMCNKTYFERNTEPLLAENNARYAYISIDINKFKLINDLFGVEKGNGLLCHIAQVLKKSTSENELAARFYADSFHLLYQYNGRSNLEKRLNAIFDDFAKYVFEVNPSYRISVGFGVYVIEDKKADISLVGDKATLALEKIKGAHSFAVYFYNDNIRNKIIEEQEIENLMQESLANREFNVHLQAKVNPYTNQIVGSEALVRWIHPQKGVIMPDQFIPVFERNGFIAELDAYVLGEVCSLLRGQLNDGIIPINVSVNQSRQYLNRPDYLQKLTAILLKHKIPANLIELEITETAFFESQYDMVSIVEKLHEMGFSVSLDDFGSGYSSFNMLQDILVDVLKIDKNFFRESINSNRGKKIVANIITMAHELGIQIVAEGVETSEQVNFLTECGCDIIQGYYYYRPAPMQELDTKWRNQTTGEKT